MIEGFRTPVRFPNWQCAIASLEKILRVSIWANYSLLVVLDQTDKKLARKTNKRFSVALVIQKLLRKCIFIYG